MIKKLNLKKKFKNVILDTTAFDNITLKGKIMIFKTLALSKIVFLSQMLSIPKEIIPNMKHIQEDFLCNSSTVKINL